MKRKSLEVQIGNVKIGGGKIGGVQIGNVKIGGGKIGGGRIGNVKIGGGMTSSGWASNPIAIQSMTNTFTADVDATYQQIIELIQAGSELVRITVNDQEAAKAVPHIKEKLLKNGFTQPIIGDFHYNGHILLTNFPACASALDKYRINPGNVGSGQSSSGNVGSGQSSSGNVGSGNGSSGNGGSGNGSSGNVGSGQSSSGNGGPGKLGPGKLGGTHAIRGAAGRHEYNFRTMIEVALKHNKPVRIGVNWGSLDQELFTKLMDENGRATSQKSDREILYEAMVQSALNSAKLAEKTGLPANKIVLSVKMSDVQDVINVYRLLARRTTKQAYALHLGLTEAGIGTRGLVASTAALAILLQQGIGDTIRISLTPAPGESRIKEVEACQLLLQTMGLRHFKPQVSSCPGCGRTGNDFYQKLAAQVNAHIDKKMPVWKQKYPGIESLRIAVMGCVVNGPGESRHADIGISLPGKTEEPIAPVYIEGRQHTVLKGATIPQQFLLILEKYIHNKYIKQKF